MLFVFRELRDTVSVPSAAAIIGFGVYALAFFGLSRLRETHASDLDYIEKYKGESPCMSLSVDR